LTGEGADEIEEGSGRIDLEELVLVGGEVGGELLHTQILHGRRFPP